MPAQLGAGQFEAWQALLAARTGIVVPQARREFLSLRLQEFLRHENGVDLESCLAHFSSSAMPGHWAQLIDQLSLQQGHFFRHQPSLDFVAQWAGERVRLDPDTALRVWNVGCGTGEETWTLAMVLHHSLAGGALLKVCGTDLGTAALEQARAAEYPEARLRELPPVYAAAYCQMAADDHFRIRAHLRGCVEFRKMHVLDSGSGSAPHALELEPPSGPASAHTAAAVAPFERVDLIFCQHLLIYFAPERRRVMLAALVSALAPGGLLVLAPGEAAGELHPQLQRLPLRGLLVYRRVQSEVAAHEGSQA